MAQDIKPFVKPGDKLSYVENLSHAGLWPPKLRGRDERPNHDSRAATPFLIIPATLSPIDMGSRPLPNSTAFHTQGVWLEDSQSGLVATIPTIGRKYRVKCRVRNIGAFPAYAGLADFFVSDVATVMAAVGTNATLPSLGHIGFSLVQGQELELQCPNLWEPRSPTDLASTIIVHAYDIMSDNLVRRFDARNDRHVGRLDLLPDIYVRDWTVSATQHDNGNEPSYMSAFYLTSDVWNRRSNNPGPITNGPPESQDPQQGAGADGDNFVFARIFRNSAGVEQTVKAHFMVSEFGTGSAFQSLSAGPDPSVVFLANETSTLISLPWRLHPTSSTHLCLAVQVYTDGDPFVPPGLEGRTPGWPTTDLMVIYDNNKAQRNMSVAPAVNGQRGLHIVTVSNAATFLRDMEFVFRFTEGAMPAFGNPRLVSPQSDFSLVLSDKEMTFKLRAMRPGEQRQLAFTYDKLDFGTKRHIGIEIDELVNDQAVNGFGITLRQARAETMMQDLLRQQGSEFWRLNKGFGISSVVTGYELCRKLADVKINAANYFAAIERLKPTFSKSVNGIFEFSQGTKDHFDLSGTLERLLSANLDRATETLSVHSQFLQALSATSSLAAQSRGNLANMLFNMRFQNDLLRNEQLRQIDLGEVLDMTQSYIAAYPERSASEDDFIRAVENSIDAFKAVSEKFGHGAVKADLQSLIDALLTNAGQVQKTHLNLLNSILQVLTG
jgi:hypothetical protein